MSRTTKSEQDEVKNPAKKFIRWDSENCCWNFWDKEKESRMALPMDTKFIVVDILSTAKGYDSKEGAFWANEVRSTQREELTVRSKSGIVAQGLWKDIKGGNIKFCSSIYACIKSGNEYELVNFQLTGCSLGPWFDFLESLGGQKELYGERVVAVTKTTPGKTGRVEYNSPVYEIVSTTLSKEASDAADAADAELQTYLKAYLTKPLRDKSIEVKKDAEVVEDEEQDEIPF